MRRTYARRLFGASFDLVAIQQNLVLPPYFLGLTELLGREVKDGDYHPIARQRTWQQEYPWNNADS